MSELEKNREIGKVLPEKEPQRNGYNFEANLWKSNLFQLFAGFHLISGVLLPFFLLWGKITFIEVMLLQSYFTIMIVIFEIPCGAISDYISRKFSLFLGGLATAFAALIYSSFPNIFIFIIGETVFALGFSLLSGTGDAFIFDTLRKLGREEEMSKIMAKNRSFFLAGLGISAPIGSLIPLYFPINS